MIKQKTHLLYNQALKSMKLKQYVKALELLQEGMALDRHDTDLLQLSGLCHYTLGNLKEALFCWQKAATPLTEKYIYKLKGEMEAYHRVVIAYNEALQLMNQKKHSTAIDKLENGLKVFPRFLLGWELLGLCFYACGKTSQCREVLKNIQLLTNDSKLLERLCYSLPPENKSWFMSFILWLLVVAGTGGYWYLSAKSETVLPPVQHGTVQQSELEMEPPKLEVDTDLLASTAETLARQGLYWASADIYLALRSDLGVSLENDLGLQLIYAKAAVYYYFSGMQDLKAGDFLSATQKFDKSMDYPVDCYVTDDVLFFKGVAHENLGQYPQAVNQYQQLLNYRRSGDYVVEALKRWGKLATEKVELRADYLQLTTAYPEYQGLFQAITKSWGELP
jgi:tetratricopeptide (TPR) repeat protein